MLEAYYTYSLNVYETVINICILPEEIGLR